VGYDSRPPAGPTPHLLSIFRDLATPTPRIEKPARGITHQETQCGIGNAHVKKKERCKVWSHGGRTDSAWWKFKSKSVNSVPHSSASSILLIFQLQFTCLGVPRFQDLFVFHIVQNISLGFFQTGSGVFAEACGVLTVRPIWRKTQIKFTSKTTLDFDFLEITKPWTRTILLEACHTQSKGSLELSHCLGC